MNGTYKAVEVSTPGVLRVVERPISKPVAGQVRPRVEACGVCHSDLATVQGDYPGLKLPRVPGHEVVGRIVEIGPNVSKWKIGQRVGVGFLGGQDSEFRLESDQTKNSEARTVPLPALLVDILSHVVRKTGRVFDDSNLCTEWGARVFCRGIGCEEKAKEQLGFHLVHVFWADCS